MALNPNDPNKLQDEDEQSGQPGMGMQTMSGQSATISGTGGGMAPSAAQSAGQPKQAGSGWTNLKTYIERNKPQAAELGSNVGKTVTDEGVKASDTIAAQSEQATAAITPDAYKVDQTWLTNSIRNNPQDAEFKKRYAEWAAKTPETFNWDNTSGDAVAAAKQKADLVNTEGGTKELLSGVQRANASAGVTNLNNLFLQGSEEGRGALSKAADDVKAMSLDEKLAQAQAAAQARQAEAGQAAANSRDAVRATTSQEADNFNENLRIRLGSELNNRRIEQEQLVQDLERGKNLTSDQLKVLGITPQQYQAYQKANANYQAALKASLQVTDGAPITRPSELPGIRKYLKLADLSDEKYNTSSIMTTEDIARAKALEGLAGISGASLKGLPTAVTNRLSEDVVNDFNLNAWLTEATRKGY